MTHELWKRYRPKRLEDFHGQPDAVRTLRGFLKKGIPHAILLTGPSGCGKTSAARLLRRELGCGNLDYCEVNAADTRGIDTVREIRSTMGMSPRVSKCRIWILDEAHQLVRKAGGDAQTALLKLLEDTPTHVYFLLCTTHPEQLLRTIITRCHEVRFKLLDAKSLEELIRGVAKKEKANVSEELVDRLVETAGGSARMALVNLERALSIDDEAERIQLISSPDTEHQAEELVKALMDPRAGWNEARGILKAVDDDPEEVRRRVLGYASAVLLNLPGGIKATNCSVILDIFGDNFYNSGRAGLVNACWQVLSARHK